MNYPLTSINPNAIIGTNVQIDPFTVIHDDVQIGEGSWIGSNVTIFPGARIGKNVKIFPGAVISAIPQDLKFGGEITTAEIGDNTTIRECVTVNRGTSDRQKTVIGPNDFASMEEVVYRRYKRILDEGKDLPQLVVIDGGKGQLGAAMKSIEQLGLSGKMTVIGIAKRLEEIFFPGDAIPLYINKKSESLKLIQQARNEAHRFAIKFHREKRNSWI
jgi:hypothetical protein